MRDHFRRFAAYNAWANRRVYDACAALAPGEYHAARPAFFGSIHRTLNHILVGDRLWQARILGESLSLPLDHELYGDLPSLRAAREAEDARLEATVAGLTPERIAGPLHYANTRGEVFATPLALVLAHVFNHQTHHRGQVHDLLSQTAVAPPPIDLIYFIRQTG
jgi:uncharacterized damage-inducible protein DinB